jgi:hypothetical protein
VVRKENGKLEGSVKVGEAIEGLRRWSNHQAEEKEAAGWGNSEKEKQKVGKKARTWIGRAAPPPTPTGAGRQESPGSTHT